MLWEGFIISGRTLLLGMPNSPKVEALSRTLVELSLATQSPPQPP
jgi:hypothetical protein